MAECETSRAPILYKLNGDVGGADKETVLIKLSYDTPLYGATACF